MKLPYLNAWDKTPVVITITGGLDKNGDKKVLATFEGLCNYNESSRIIRSADGQLIQLNASITVKGDIAPSVPVLAGTVTVKGKTWNIQTSGRPMSPDGSAHHTSLGLI